MKISVIQFSVTPNGGDARRTNYRQGASALANALLDIGGVDVGYIRA